MIKPWVFEFFPELATSSGNSAEPAAVAKYFQTYLDIWARAETLGYEGIFFSEHHFGNAYSPSPDLSITAAGRTRCSGSA